MFLVIASGEGMLTSPFSYSEPAGFHLFILTYLFDGCILASYLNINHIKYGYYHVEQTDTGHQFKEGFRQTTPEQKQKIKSLLNIYEGPLNTNYLSKKE